ncbi:MAG: hypothetical protein ACRDK9_03255 [Solirubrobacterales bacterium]
MPVPSTAPTPIEIEVTEEIELTEQEILADLLFPAPVPNGSPDEPAR